MEKKTLYLIYVIIVLPFAVACRDTEDNLTVSTLRSDIHDYLYTINNSEATQHKQQYRKRHRSVLQQDLQ